MRGYFGLGQLSSEEKSDILDQHKSVYNGYQTMQPQVSNTQPLTVYDFAGDKEGLVVNNKGEVKKYSNMGINEQVEEKSMCEQCGGQMTEGECMECGYNEGEMEESDSDWDATLMDGLEEETGHLDDIYKVRDLNLKHGDFDYVEGGGNDVDTFEGMHKNLYKEDEEEDMEDYENPDNEDDGFLDDELDEQGGYRKVTDDPIEPGYDFKNKGPEQFGDDTYSVKADDMDLDDEEEWGAFDFTSGGPDDVYPVNEYETMESAFADEIDEVDVSGSQGIYGDMDPAYDFDSEGPGKGGPYQEFSYEGEEDEDSDFDGDDSEEEEWEEIDTDLQEGFKNQKNKIMEMFNRFNKYN
jgi:hypothetical protein